MSQLVAGVGPEPSAKFSPSPQRVRVLCIDDDPSIVDSLARQLKRRGFRVLKAYHGMQGYWAACTEQPDVIITDLSMPMGDGEFVLECLGRNAATRSIPTIVLTGLRAVDTRRRISRLGVRYFFVKPTPIEHLIHAVCRVTKRRRRRPRRRPTPGADE